MKTLLVIGAGGFIGGHIVSEGLKRGYDTWAGVRDSTSRRYLSGKDIHFITFDYDDPAQIRKALTEGCPQGGRWDYIIWNLGATKCANFQDFNRINYTYVKNFLEVLSDLGMMPERFLYMSSLSALGPANEKSGEPLDGATLPRPNTRYGLSKIKTETYLESHPDIPWVIFRPTGVYGPHEKDYLMMIESIDRHFDFAVGYKKQFLTFIYVSDLVGAMFDALNAGVLHKKYIISEPRAYTQGEFRKIVSAALGDRWVIPVKLPMWAVYITSYVAEKIGAIRMKPSTLNRDKFKIMKQRNWRCDVSDAIADFGFKCEYPLERGIAETVKAYQEMKSTKE